MPTTINLDLLNVDMFLAEKEKSDRVLLEIIKAQKAKISELEELIDYRNKHDIKVSPAGLITPKDAAKYIGVSEYLAREGARQGYYHEVPWSGNIMYRLDEIDGYIRSCCSSKLKAV